MSERTDGVRGVIDLERADPDALKVVRKLLAAGHEAYLVGGCVRDLYLGKRPKDFDVATSATPEAIRKTFRNSRIIGRRFKLAHVFYGSKIIETSTFRAAPPEATGDEEDLLIKHDNEWGSIEEDARRRDFTINGLFYDLESERVVDFVDGMADLDASIVRTIGDPVVRFREDPVRMIRAIKFAARLDFKIEEATWNALLEVVPDIVKCSQARLIEELYKLLRGGAAHRSFELMQECGLLERIMPAYLALHEPHGGLRKPADAEASEPSLLFWRYLEALDNYTVQTRHSVGNAVLQAALFAPLAGLNGSAEGRQALDRHLDDLMTPVCASMAVARRDRELARQIMMATERMTAGTRGRRRSSLLQRQYFHDALIFLGLTVHARDDGDGELRQWQRLAAAQRTADQLGDSSDGSPSKKRRRRGGRRRRKGSGSRGEGSSAGRGNDAASTASES